VDAGTAWDCHAVVRKPKPMREPKKDRVVVLHVKNN